MAACTKKKKSYKLLAELFVTMIYLAKLYVQERPRANEHYFVSMQHQALYMKTFMYFIFASDIN